MLHVGESWRPLWSVCSHGFSNNGLLCGVGGHSPGEGRRFLTPLYNYCATVNKGKKENDREYSFTIYFVCVALHVLSP